MLNISRYPRLLAFALLAGLLIIKFAIAVGPHIWVMNLTRQAEYNSATLKSMRHKLKEMARLRHEHGELISKGFRDDLLLQGGTAGVISAELQKIVRNKIFKTGAQISTIFVQKMQPENNLQRFKVDVSFTSTIHQLRTLLYQMEAGEPFLFVDKLSIQRESFESGQAATRDVKLTVGLQVSGFSLSETGNDR